MKRRATLTEAKMLGHGVMILCDVCGATIDHIRDESFWADLVESGEMYAGEVKCFVCHDGGKQKGGE